MLDLFNFMFGPGLGDEVNAEQLPQVWIPVAILTLCHLIVEAKYEDQCFPFSGSSAVKALWVLGHQLHQLYVVEDLLQREVHLVWYENEGFTILNVFCAFHSNDAIAELDWPSKFRHDNTFVHAPHFEHGDDVQRLNIAIFRQIKVYWFRSRLLLLLYWCQINFTSVRINLNLGFRLP